MELEIMKQLGVLEEAVRTLVGSAQRMEDRALEERHEIYQRIDNVRDEISKLAASIKVHDERLDSMEPIVKQLSDREQRSIGSKYTGKLVWTAIISLITVAVSIGSQVLQFFHGTHTATH